MNKDESEPDEIERIINEKKQMIARKKEGIENCKIPYLEAIAKLRYPQDFQEISARAFGLRGACFCLSYAYHSSLL